MREAGERGEDDRRTRGQPVNGDTKGHPTREREGLGGEKKQMRK